MLAATKSSSALVDLAPYVVATVSIIASVLTVLLTRRGGHHAWLRDARLTSYAELLELGAEAWRIISATAKAQSLDDVRRLNEECLEPLHRMIAVAGRIQIVGPASVYLAASDYHRAFRAAFDVVGFGRTAGSAPGSVVSMFALDTPEGKAVANAEQAFVSAAGNVIQ